MWLEKTLPGRIPSARIMTFGYDSGMAFMKAISTGGVREVAYKLLGAVKCFQQQSNKPGARPIVFIGHDLGGTIIKQVTTPNCFQYRLSLMR